MKRHISIGLTLLFIVNTFPIPAFAIGKKSVAIAESTDDEQSSDLANEIQNILSYSDDEFHLIDRSIIKQVIDYYNEGKNNASVEFAEAKDFLARAQNHYFRMHYEEARAESIRAIELLDDDPASINRKGHLLFDALMTQALIARALNDNDLLDRSIDRAIMLDPVHQLDESSYSPSMVRLFEDRRSRLKKGGVGEVHVDTNPQVAEVFLNGIECGVTPLKMNNLPAGRYAIMIRTNKYSPVTTELDLTPGKIERISVKLKWAGDKGRNGDGHSADLEDDEEIERALRVAELIKADKAVLVSANEDVEGNGQARARVVDRRYRAAFRPIVAHYDSSDRDEVLTQLTDQISEFLSQDISDDPAEYADPNAVADPILLGKRKKKIYTHPVFWGVVGTAAAGALAGGILAAVGGGSSDVGAIRVRFR